MDPRFRGDDEGGGGDDEGGGGDDEGNRRDDERSGGDDVPVTPAPSSSPWQGEVRRVSIADASRREGGRAMFSIPEKFDGTRICPLPDPLPVPPPARGRENRLYGRNEKP